MRDKNNGLMEVLRYLLSFNIIYTIFIVLKKEQDMFSLPKSYFDQYTEFSEAKTPV